MISVLVPTYNRLNFLRENIATVRKQTKQDLEVIVSDNASTDGTREFCEITATEWPQLRYFRQQHSIGQIRNWRFCLEQARGELTCIVCDDDFLIDDEYLQRGSDLLLRYGARLLVTACLLDWGGGEQSAVQLNLPELVSGREFFERFWVGTYGIPVMSCIFDRKLALECGAFLDADVLYSDIALWLKLMLHTDVVVYPRPSILYRFHGNNVVNSMGLNRHRKNAVFIDRVAKFARESGLDLTIVGRWRRRMYEHYMYRIVIPDCLTGSGNFNGYLGMARELLGNSAVPAAAGMYAAKWTRSTVMERYRRLAKVV